ncbi:MAG: hypothetical protein V1813_02770 [Candidatus Aenigmatarchaeota archaeon]
MKILTQELYNAAKGVANYIEEHIDSCGDMVFGPSKASELALSEVAYRRLDERENIKLFCDNDKVYKKIKSMYPDVKIERITARDMRAKILPKERPNTSVDHRYLYVNGADAYTDSRVILVGSDPKMYETTTLEDIKKMGYYAIPFLVPMSIHDRACLNMSEKSVPSIGSEALPIPVEVAKGSEQTVRKYMHELFMDSFNMQANIKAREIHKSAKGYPKDLSLMSLTFKGFSDPGKLVAIERGMLDHPDINAVGIHATVRPEIILIGDERGYTLNETKYHPLSIGKDKSQ